MRPPLALERLTERTHGHLVFELAHREAFDPDSSRCKQVPDELVDAIRRVQKGQQPAAHEALGASPNARLIASEPALLTYLADRFAAVGPAAVCAEKLRAVVAAGVDGLLVPGLVADRGRLIRTLGKHVLLRLTAR